MPKNFFCLKQSKDLLGDRTVITGSDVHHIRNVLRLKPGDELTLQCEDNLRFRTQIETINSREVHLRVMECLSSPSYQTSQPKSLVILIQGIPKHTKMDIIIQKATELGVEEIIPLASAHSFTNAEGNISQGRWIRWQKIGTEAAKQSGRTTIPKIHTPVKFSELNQLIGDEDTIRLLLWEKEQQNKLKAVISQFISQYKRDKKIFLLIGPEGGFSPNEVQQARQLGFIPVSCGPWTLRTETAALYALSVIQYEFNFL